MADDNSIIALRDQGHDRCVRPAQRVHQPRLGVAPEGEAVQAPDRGVVGFCLVADQHGGMLGPGPAATDAPSGGE